MGRLIDKDRRARAKEAKKERMANIRQEAIRSFVKLPYVEITLDAVGRRAGVKKGVASMYFGSKEELFLQLFRDQLEAWYGELEKRLGAQQARLANAKLAKILAGTLAARSVLCRLMSLSTTVLEQNMEIIEAYRFHSWQKDRMVAVGTELERRSASLAKGDGIHLLHLVQLMAGAMHPIADPRGTLAVNLHDPDFESLKIDLEGELESIVRKLLQKD
jgi:AcrR family transcriptional regulator